MTREEFIEAVTHKIDYQHNKDGTKLNTEILIDEVNSFADLVELAIYKWNNGFITKQEAINDINTKLDHINNFIPRLGFGREDKHEQ
ncbi:hypothetical protein [Lactobacillus bombicola]|nr:hypothetical protein [Lactobacillus bombicola]